MIVEARAYVRNEDIRRILKKAECEPGEVFDLPEGLAEVYLKEGWVVMASGKKTVEVAAHAGAPERAVSRRGGLTRASMQPKPPGNEE